MKCNYANNGQTHKSGAYAESYDGGLTFVKVNYPNNQVLTGTDQPTDGQQTGAGDLSVIRWRDKYWMYFYDWNQSAGTGVAISSLQDGGKPGTWKKWYNGSFSQPGLGGNTTIIGWFGTSVSHYQPADRLALIVVDVGFGGVRLRFTNNGVDFNEQLGEPLMVVEDENWLNRDQTGELIGYPSIMAPNGSRSWIDRFYLTYMYLQPNENFQKRYIVVREVLVTTNPQPVSPQVRIALTRYFSSNRNDHWVTTAMPPSDYQKEYILGYLFTKDYGGMTKVVDCYIPDWDDHMVDIGNCPAGTIKLRTLGWVYSNSQPGTVALHRCYFPDWTDHWVSTIPCDQEGSGVQEEFIIGWVSTN